MHYLIVSLLIRICLICNCLIRKLVGDSMRLSCSTGNGKVLRTLQKSRLTAFGRSRQDCWFMSMFAEYHCSRQSASHFAKDVGSRPAAVRDDCWFMTMLAGDTIALGKVLRTLQISQVHHVYRLPLHKAKCCALCKKITSPSQCALRRRNKFFLTKTKIFKKYSIITRKINKYHLSR
jgi:hypothetical protein